MQFKSHYLILHFGGIINKTVIPLVLVKGACWIIANSAQCSSLAIYHLISNARSWNNCSLFFLPSCLHVSKNYIQHMLRGKTGKILYVTFTLRDTARLYIIKEIIVVYCFYDVEQP